MCIYINIYNIYVRVYLFTYIINLSIYYQNNYIVNLYTWMLKDL